MLKNILTLLSLAYLITGCSSLRPTASRQGSQASATPAQPGSSIEFINTITIRPEARKGEGAGGPIETPAAFKINSDENARVSRGSAASIEKYSALQFKFAILENASVEDLSNSKLLSFMEYWYGTHYQYGGTTREGIDCSAFAFLLMSSVYGVAVLPRTAKEQYAACRKIHRDELQEGDLVFFHTLGKHRAVTHVGVYLRNNKFIHASISGVMISDMNDGYYDRHFIGAGRVQEEGGGPGITLTVNP